MTRETSRSICSASSDFVGVDIIDEGEKEEELILLEEEVDDDLLCV